MNALQSLHDDPGPHPGRRKFIVAALSMASLALVDPWAVVHATADATGFSAFMAVSKRISADSPNPITGQALYAALKQSDPNFDTRLDALAAQFAAKPDMTIEALAADLDRSKQTMLRDTLNTIVSAWYLGVVGYRTYAYENAWMFRTTADVLSPPSYVHGGPLSWADANPPH